MREVRGVLFKDTRDPGEVVIIKENREGADARGYTALVKGENQNPDYELKDVPDFAQFLMYQVEGAARPFILINDERGKAKHLQLNRPIRNRNGMDVIAGHMLVVAAGGEPGSYAPDSLTDEEIELVKKHFDTSNIPDEAVKELHEYEYWKDLNL